MKIGNVIFYIAKKQVDTKMKKERKRIKSFLAKVPNNVSLLGISYVIHEMGKIKEAKIYIDV